MLFRKEIKKTTKACTKEMLLFLKDLFHKTKKDIDAAIYIFSTPKQILFSFCYHDRHEHWCHVYLGIDFLDHLVSKLWEGRTLFYLSCTWHIILIITFIYIIIIVYTQTLLVPLVQCDNWSKAVLCRLGPTSHAIHLAERLVTFLRFYFPNICSIFPDASPTWIFKTLKITCEG